MLRIVLTIIVCIIGTFFFTLNPAVAQDGPAAPSKDAWMDGFRKNPSVTIHSTIRSGYILDHGPVLSEDPVIQSGLYVMWGNGVFFDAWHSTGLTSGFNTGFDDEIDLTIGLAGKIEENFQFEIGFSYFNLYPLDDWGGENFLRPYGDLSRPFKVAESHTLSPYIRGEGYWATDGSVKAEYIISGGLRHRWDVGDHWTVSQRLSLVHDSGFLGLNRGLTGNYEVGLDWHITNNITFKPIGFKVTTPLNSPGDGRGTEWVIGTGIFFSF